MKPSLLNQPVVRFVNRQQPQPATTIRNSESRVPGKQHIEGVMISSMVRIEGERALQEDGRGEPKI